MTEKPAPHWPQWIGIAIAIFGAGGTFHVVGERQEKQAITVADHEQRIRNMEGSRRLEDMVSELKTVIHGQSVKIEALEKRIAELTAQRRR